MRVKPTFTPIDIVFIDRPLPFAVATHFVDAMAKETFNKSLTLIRGQFRVIIVQPDAFMAVENLSSNKLSAGTSSLAPTKADQRITPIATETRLHVKLDVSVLCHACQSKPIRSMASVEVCRTTHRKPRRN